MQPRQGMTLINKGGEIKEVTTRLAYDQQLQKQHNFFPCDEAGNALPQNQEQAAVVAEEKKSQAAVAVEVKVEIPSGSNIINPLDEAQGNPYEKDTVEAKIFDLHKAGKAEAEIKEETKAHVNTIRKVVKAATA